MSKAWGLRGELKLELHTNDPERFLGAAAVQLAWKNSSAPYQVEHFRWHGRDLLLKLRGCDNRTQAEDLEGCLVQVSEQDAPPLPPNVFYHYQLIGLRVVTLEGEELGRLDEILETGANDVYIVRGPRGEILLPARVEVVRQVDLERGVMTVHLLPGLLELAA